MKNSIAIIVLLLPVFSNAQQKKQILPSSVYSWKEPQKEIYKNILSVVLFEGEATDMEYLRMTANAIKPAKIKTNIDVPLVEERLLFIKGGAVSLSMRDSTWLVGAGSVALLMPGEKYSLQNKGSETCTYYEMRYKSKLPVDYARAKTGGGSLVKDWNKIQFKPSERGGRRNYFERPTAMCKRLELHVTTLHAGLKSHEPHAHPSEEIILVIDAKTEMQIGDGTYKGNGGDIYYVNSNVLHGIRNDSTDAGSYFALRFE